MNEVCKHSIWTKTQTSHVWTIRLDHVWVALDLWSLLHLVFESGTSRYFVHFRGCISLLKSQEFASNMKSQEFASNME